MINNRFCFQALAVFLASVIFSSCAFTHRVPASQEIFARDANGLYVLESPSGDIVVRRADDSKPFDIFAPYDGYPALPVTSKNGKFPGKGVLDAFVNGRKVLDILQNTFGQLGMDGRGAPLKIVLYPGESAQSGEFLQLGLREGDKDLPAVTSLVEIMGHEMFHQILRNTSGIEPETLEASALHEALSDVFGIYVKHKVTGKKQDYNQGIGMQAGNVPSRSLANPAKFDGADHYSKLDASDAHGHRNAGIVGLAFYLFAEGGKHPTRGGSKMKGVGIEMAVKIFFEFSTTKLSKDATFHEARLASLLVAKKHGPQAVESLTQAWEMVGVR